MRIGGPAVAPSAAAAPATTASATSTYDPPAAPSAPAAPSLPSPPLPSSTSLLLVEQEEVGTAAGEELLVVEARNIRAKLNRLRWSYRQLVFPFMKVRAGEARAVWFAAGKEAVWCGLHFQ